MYQLFFVGLLYITLNFCACDSMLLMIFDLKTEFPLTWKKVNRLPYQSESKHAIQLGSSKLRVWSFKTVFHHLYFYLDTLLTSNKQVLVTEWWEWYWAQNENWQHFPDRKYFNAEPAFIWTISGITWTSQLLLATEGKKNQRNHIEIKIVYP